MTSETAGNAKRGPAIVAGWLLISSLLTLPAYLWHVNRFRSTGPFFLAICALPLVAAAAVGYTLYLRKWARSLELALLLQLPAMSCLVLQPRAFLALILISSTALVLGDCFTSWMGFEIDDAPIAIACGFGFLVLIGAALGKAGLLYPLAIYLLTAACLCRGWFIRKRLLNWLAQPFAKWHRGEELGTPITGVAVFFLILVVVCGLLIALTPVATFDVLLYHFPLAKHYIEKHAIEPVATIPESYFPQGSEVLLSFAFALGAEPAARFLMPLLGVIMLWILVRIARCAGLSRGVAVVGASIAATFPFLQWTMSVAKDDTALALFQIAALYSFLQWQRKRGERWLILMALFLAQTAGTKHVAIFGLAAMAPLFAFAWMRERFSWRILAATTVLFCVTGLFWHFFNWRLTGSPVYPLQASSATHTPAAEHTDRFVRAMVRYATMPWYLLFHGEKSFESVSPNPLGLFGFFFLPAVLLRWRSVWSHPLRMACFCFACAYMAYWSTLVSTLRYAIVPFALLAVALAASILRLLESSQAVIRAAVFASSVYAFLFSFLVVMTIETNSSQVAVLLNRLTAEEYLDRVIPAVRPLFRLSRDFPHASAAGVGSCARYYAPNPIDFACLLCEQTCNLEDIYHLLDANEREYVVVPSGLSFQSVRSAIEKKYRATLVAEEGNFEILRLGAK